MSLLRLLCTGKGPMDGWIARAYDQGVQAAFREVFPALVEDIFARVEGARRGLDVGCGPGQFTILIAERSPQSEIWGIDLAPTMIKLARRHAAESASLRGCRRRQVALSRQPLRRRGQQRFDQALARSSGCAARDASGARPRRSGVHRGDESAGAARGHRRATRSAAALAVPLDLSARLHQSDVPGRSPERVCGVAVRHPHGGADAARRRVLALRGPQEVVSAALHFRRAARIARTSSSGTSSGTGLSGCFNTSFPSCTVSS
jgi:SAM-dependent methyltransferase